MIRSFHYVTRVIEAARRSLVLAVWLLKGIPDAGARCRPDFQISSRWWDPQQYEVMRGVSEALELYSQQQEQFLDLDASLLLRSAQ